MPQQLSAVTIETFTARVKHYSQAEGGLLRKYCQLETGVKGDRANFYKIGKSVAVRRGAPGTRPAGNNLSPEKRTAIVEPWISRDWTDKFLPSQISFNAIDAAARSAAMAVARREDQIIIDALVAATVAGGNQIADSVGGTTSNLNFAKLNRLKKLMDARGVPREGRVVIMAAAQQESLLGDPKLTNRDYIQRAVLDTGKLPPFLGFQFEVIPDMDEGGVPIATGTRTCFGWQKNAMGYAISQDFMTEVSYQQPEKSHLIDVDFQAGAVDVDVNDIYEIACTDAADYDGA